MMLEIRIAAASYQPVSPQYGLTQYRRIKACRPTVFMVVSNVHCDGLLSALGSRPILLFTPVSLGKH
jgi:hypothetical protein